jgi:hypothetical protein
MAGEASGQANVANHNKRGGRMREFRHRKGRSDAVKKAELFVINRFIHDAQKRLEDPEVQLPFDRQTGKLVLAWLRARAHARKDPYRGET